MKKFLNNLDGFTISLILAFILIAGVLLFGCWQRISLNW